MAGRRWLVYSPQTQKALLPYDSAQSKLVRKGTAKLCLWSSLTKSCPYAMQDSLNVEVCRLLSAGFPSTVVTAVVEALLHETKVASSSANSGLQCRWCPEVFLYMHRISHNMQKMASKHKVPVVFSGLRKLTGICSSFSSAKKNEPNSCRKKHAQA